MSSRVLVLILLCAIVGTAAAGSGEFSRLYAFGDSYTDDGAGYGVKRSMVAHGVADVRAKPGALYWHRRWSNGPVTVEVLADLLDLPLSDYAIGGAKAGVDNYYAWMNRARPTGTRARIDAYLSQNDGQDDPGALYFLFTSANGFFAHEDFDAPGSVVEPLTETAARQAADGAWALLAAGARDLLFVGSADLTHVPAVVTGGQVDNAGYVQTRFNTRLRNAIGALRQGYAGATLRWFDHGALARRVRQRADVPGVTDLDTPCQPTYPKTGPRCDSPDTHYYWDEWHPTRRVHRLAGGQWLDRSDRHRIREIPIRPKNEIVGPARPASGRWSRSADRTAT